MAAASRSLLRRLWRHRPADAGATPRARVVESRLVAVESAVGHLEATLEGLQDACTGGPGSMTAATTSCCGARRRAVRPRTTTTTAVAGRDRRPVARTAARRGRIPARAPGAVPRANLRPACHVAVEAPGDRACRRGSHRAAPPRGTRPGAGSGPDPDWSRRLRAGPARRGRASPAGRLGGQRGGASGRCARSRVHRSAASAPARKLAARNDLLRKRPSPHRPPSGKASCSRCMDAGSLGRSPPPRQSSPAPSRPRAPPYARARHCRAVPSRSARRARRSSIRLAPWRFPLGETADERRAGDRRRSGGPGTAGPARPGRGGAGWATISVVIPTLNEAANLPHV